MVAQWNAINDNYKGLDGYKRVAWPPTADLTIVREFTPQPSSQYQPDTMYNKQMQQPHSPHETAHQYAPHQHQNTSQPHYNTEVLSQNQYPQQYQCQQPQPEKQFQQPLGYQQQQYLPRPYQAPNQNFRNQVPEQQEQFKPSSYQPQQYEPMPAQFAYNSQHQVPDNHYQGPPQNNFSMKPNQQFNSHLQSQGHQNVSHDHTDNYIQKQHYDQREDSPSVMLLRKEAPVTQKPSPVYASQPAAVSYKGGSKLRGDLKWPPPECKAAMEREKEHQRQLSLGPAVRPTKVKKDYTSFFAKNALTHHYPNYKIPPGTQHM